MDEAFNDPRFGHIVSDPKFKKPPAFQRKVKIDKRFQRMFKDKNFQVKYTVDKRGKPVNQSSVENYGKFYALSDDDSDDTDSSSASSMEEQEDTKEKSKAESYSGRNKKVLDKNKKGSKKVKDCEENVEKHIKNKLKAKKKGFHVEDKITNEEESVDDDDDDDDDDEEEEEEEEEEEKKKEEDSDEDSDRETEETSDESEEDIPNEVKEEALKKISQKRKLPQEIKEKLHDLSVDYARGMGVLSEDSSSDDSSEDISAAEEDDLEHDWGELDKDAERTDSATRRVAICNMDWDRIRAVDLLVLCSSFLPPGGLIKSVSIYMSEFGRKRMEEEEVRGPIEIVEQRRVESGIDLENREEDDEEGDKYQMEQLRKYQLLRLKYYYAIVECDSVDTACTLYDECDGLEYESSATRLDLRFVPDDVTFDEEPRDVCTKLPDINKYQPRLFLNTALQQGKVECTWDETDPERVKLAQKLHQMKGDDNIDDKELKMFLASSEEEEEVVEDQPPKKSITNDDAKDSDDSNSEESDNSDSNDGVKEISIDKYRKLLAEMQQQDEKKKNRDVEMEITWGVGLKEKAQKMVDKKLKENVQMTPFEKIIEKKREKKKLKKKERMKRNGEDTTNGKDENDSDEASSDDDIPDGIDMNDDYFREELEGFGPKKSKNNNKNKKNKRKSDSDDGGEEEERNANELDLLLMDENVGETQKKHFNLKMIMENEDDSKKKKKKKRRKQIIKNKKKEEVSTPYDDDFKINVADERFSALYSSHHFNIDPADAHYRKTKGMEAFIHEKLNRKDKDQNTNSSSLGKKSIESVKPLNDDGLHSNPAKKQKLDSTNDLSQIVNSIKRNTQFTKTKR